MGFDSVCVIVYFNMVINLNGANTFVLADTKKEDDNEYFLYNKIIHAKDSSLEKFLILLEKEFIPF